MIDIDKQKELSNCNFVKAVLAIIIVLYHSILFWGGTWLTVDPIYSSRILPMLAKWMNSFHVYAFVLVSGYVFYHLKYNLGKYKKVVPFITNKAKRLLVPYLFIAIVWVIPIEYLLFGFDSIGFAQRYVLCTAPSQLWFLLMLFGVFVIFWILSDFFYKHDLLGAVVVLSFYGTSIIGPRFVQNVFQVWTVCGCIPLFWIGFKICQHGSVLLRKIPFIAWFAMDIALFASREYISLFDGTMFSLLGLGLSFLLKIIGAIMAFVGLQKLADKINWKENKLFSLFSKSSMPVYLIHQQLVYFSAYLFNGLVNPYVHSALNFIFATVVSVAISAWLMRYKATRFLIGEK